MPSRTSIVRNISSFVMSTMFLFSLVTMLSATMAAAGRGAPHHSSCKITRPPHKTTATSGGTCDQTKCVDYVNSCGLTYGGCYADCPGLPTPTYQDPGCPTSTSTSISSTSSCTVTLCVDYINSCGLMYGGCYADCPGLPTPTFKDPGCPTTSSTIKTLTTTTSSASCGFLCADYVDDCGNTYGPGCYTSCPGQAPPSFTTPSCSITKTTSTSTTTPASCGFLCADYVDDCGNTYGPGCYTSCPGQAPPSFTTPSCSITKTSSTRSTTATSCGFICQDYFDDCGNTYGPGCYTSCPGQAPPSYTTPSCSATTTTSTSITSCGYICQDYFDDCGNTYGPGCYTSCPGQAPPSYTTPSCSATTTTSTSTTSCGYICQDYFDDCGNTYGPGCYTSCPGQAPPSYTTPSCSATTTTAAVTTA